jgi:hypothetical protein
MQFFAHKNIGGKYFLSCVFVFLMIFQLDLLNSSSSSSRNDGLSILSNSNIDPQVEYRGYIALREFLKKQTIRPVPQLTLRFKTSSSSNSSSSSSVQQQSQEKILTGVSFLYENDPYPGWTKEILLKLSGKSKGNLFIGYLNHYDTSRKFSNIEEIRLFFVQESSKLPILKDQLIEKFDFSSVFCICQKKEDPFRNYVECSYGKCGCNTWIHPECVGLGSRSEKELKDFHKVICPFCSIYLMGIDPLIAHNQEQK